jgi:hypothetical protein
MNGSSSLTSILLRVGDEVRADVAAVELHAFDDVELGLEGLRLLDRDHALVADLAHGVGEHAADFFVAVGRNHADLGDLLAGRDLLRTLSDVLDHGGGGLIDTALEVHRIHAGGDRLGALANDRLRQNRGGGRAVAGDLPGFHGDLLDQLGAHVLEMVGEFDLLGDRDAVFGDARRAEAFLDHHVAPARPEGHFDGVGQIVDAAQHLVAGARAEPDLFRSHDRVPWLGGRYEHVGGAAADHAGHIGRNAHRKTASAQQGCHRAARCHQAARRVAAHQLKSSVLSQRLLERQLGHVLDRLAAAGRALHRHVRPQPATTAAARAGLAQSIVDREGHHPLLPEGVQGRTLAPGDLVRICLKDPADGCDLLACLDPPLRRLGRGRDLSSPGMEVDRKVGANALLQCLGQLADQNCPQLRRRRRQ